MILLLPQLHISYKRRPLSFLPAAEIKHSRRGAARYQVSKKPLNILPQLGAGPLVKSIKKTTQHRPAMKLKLFAIFVLSGLLLVSAAVTTPTKVAKSKAIVTVSRKAEQCNGKNCGCYRGYCWTYCSFGSQWCYTKDWSEAHSKPCGSKHSICWSDWKCSGACTV